MNTPVVEAPFSGTLRRLVAEGIRPPCAPDKCAVGMLINTNIPLVDDIHPILSADEWPDETTRKTAPAGMTYVAFRHCSNCGDSVCEFHGVEPDNLEAAEERLRKLFKGKRK